MPCQGSQQAPDRGRVVLDSAHQRYVQPNDLIQIITHRRTGLFFIQVEIPRPPSHTGERRDVPQSHIGTMQSRSSTALEKRTQRDGPGRVPHLDERHGPHQNPANSAHASVTGGVILRRRGTGEDELPRADPVITLPADQVPK